MRNIYALFYLPDKPSLVNDVSYAVKECNSVMFENVRVLINSFTLFIIFSVLFL